MYKFLLKFHRGLYLRFELTYSSIGSDNGCVSTTQQAIV